MGLITLTSSLCILFGLYSEFLFLIAVAASFTLLWRKIFCLAGSKDAETAITHQQNIFMYVPRPKDIWENDRYKYTDINKPCRVWRCFLLIIGGTLVWLTEHAFRLADFHVNQVYPHEFQYLIIVSSTTRQKVPIKQFNLPWQTLISAILKSITGQDFAILVIITEFFLLILLLVSWDKMGTDRRLYSFVTILRGMDYFTSPIHRDMGLLSYFYRNTSISTAIAALSKKPFRVAVAGNEYTLNGYSTTMVCCNCQVH
jgi:hypothetical protein